MGKLPKKTTKTDQSIGRLIRVHRLSKGLTQSQLGAKLGVTFQQIQKYENGKNRVGSGRLFAIAGIFEIPVTAFFEEEKALRNRHPSPFDLLNDSLSLLMLKEFSKLRRKETRHALLALVEKLVPARRGTSG
jgi:transcriptional regulator with XRE-family HTH domain